VQTVRLVVAKQRSQTTEFVGTTAVSIKSVGSAGAAALRKSACIWADDNRGTVVSGGGVSHESLGDDGGRGEVYDGLFALPVHGGSVALEDWPRGQG
jgi:hypothetical protein